MLLPPDPDPLTRASPPTGARGDQSAPRRLDEHQLPPVQQLRDGAGLLDLRVRVADRVMQGLDVDAWDLHDEKSIPCLRVHISSSARSFRSYNPAMRSEVFAEGLLTGRVVLVTGGGSGLGRAA